MQKPQNIKEKIIWFVLLNFGLIITAAGVALFKSPNHFATGGTSGMAIIIAHYFPNLNVSGAMTIINIFLIILGFIFLGRSFGVATAYASLAMSFYVGVFEKLVPLSEPLTNSPFLELIWAVLLPAVGSGIVFNIGASTGGTDIIAMIVTKYSALPIGKALLVSDFLITLATFWIFDVTTGLYCVLGLLIKTFMVDMVIDSINSRKYITIISKEPEKIEKFIIEKLNRSATLTEGEGAYSHQKETVITTVLTRSQAVALRNYIRVIDKKAFITMVNSSEIIGKGFRDI
jgi:uncharacterized membrane-anchored protein YitT (DUF2179 family)